MKELNAKKYLNPYRMLRFSPKTLTSKLILTIWFLLNTAIVILLVVGTIYIASKQFYETKHEISYEYKDCDNGKLRSDDKSLHLEFLWGCLSTEELGSKVKEKYPEYNNLTNLETGQKILQKYPEYLRVITPETKIIPITVNDYIYFFLKSLSVVIVIGLLINLIINPFFNALFEIWNK